MKNKDYDNEPDWYKNMEHTKDPKWFGIAFIIVVVVCVIMNIMAI